MKAIQIQQFGDADVLEYVTLDKPVPSAGEILIKVASASVNYSDIARRSNTIYPFPTPLPFVPGNEVAGTVEALGEGVDAPAIGTPVFALVGNGANGYAQYAVTPAQQVIPIPDSVDMNHAAALPVAGTTALMILRELGQLQAGESVLIQGAAGGVGSYAVQLAKVLGAGKIIGVTSSDEKFEMIRELGADEVVNYTEADWSAQVRELTDGRGVDVILEMNGGDSFAHSLQCLAPFGRVVVYGMASGEPLVFDSESIIRFFYDPSLNQSIHVFNLGMWFGMKPQLAARAMSDLITYVASGQIAVSIGEIMPLSLASKAHQLIESRVSTGKIILKPWDEN